MSANVTDPLAKPIHGTNPQNLIEYITRQRIYDSRYWKEQCFGLTAEDVTEKSALQLKAIGGTYGDNSKPTRFISLILKMLQIQPEAGIVEELIQNEDFKYVRALGAFYLRLTGRPKDIYEQLEPLYHDYRKLKCRNRSDWSLVCMDEFVDMLLREDRVCGIALPRLPKRDMLVESGYLDGPRVSAVHGLLGQTDSNNNDSDGDDDYRKVKEVHNLLLLWARDGNEAAKKAVEMKKIIDPTKPKEDSSKKNNINNGSRKRKYEPSSSSQTLPTSEHSSLDAYGRSASIQNNREESVVQEHQSKTESSVSSLQKDGNTSKRKKKSKTKKYGSLFKSSSSSDPSNNNGKKNTDKKERKEKQSERESTKSENDNNAPPEEGSEEYWNVERAKLGLKPLRKK